MNMTDEEMISAIAKQMVDLVFWDEESHSWRWMNNDWEVEFDPLNDLNAMHEAVSTLSYEIRMDFQDHLADVVDAGDAATYWWEVEHYRDKVLNATARQRAEAFIKTLNLESK